MTAIKKLFFGKKNDVDMTEGSIAGNIIKFALPLLFGNLFQQLYNMVDTLVMGNSGDGAGYAAVGNVGPITNILIGLFLGFSSGAGVIISQYYGAKQYDDVKKAVHTSMKATLLLSVVFTIVGMLMSPLFVMLMLRTTDLSNQVFIKATTYLVIYFAGASGLMIYNIGSGILRAVGDSKRPFYYLVVSAVTNIVLDLLFVFVFRWGAAGVALATIIAQFISAFLVWRTLTRSDSCIKLIRKDLKIDKPMLKKIIKIGFPASLQMAITSFSNVFVQSYIANISPISLSEVHLQAWTTYSKLDQLLFLPVQSIALSVTTFVGQNLGVGNIKRAKKGTAIGYLMATGIAVAIMIPVMLFADKIAPILNSDPKVVEFATMFLRTITPFFLCSCVNQVFAGAMRGAGNTIAPMCIMLGTFVGFRQLYLFTMSMINNTALFIGLGYPAGWFMCAVCTLIYYFCFFNYSKARLVGKSK